MPIPDYIKRLINSIFVTYEWADELPVDFTPDEGVIDVYTDICAKRSADDIMEKVDEELASMADDQPQVTTGERRLIYNRIMNSCRSRCERNLRTYIERSKQERFIEEDDDVTDYGDDDDDWENRSPEDYLAGS